MERFGELEVVMSPPVASGKFSLMSASKSDSRALLFDDQTIRVNFAESMRCHCLPFLR